MLTKLDRMRESLRVREGQEHRAGAVAEDETPRLLFVSAGIPEATMSESTDIRNADAEPNILGVGVEEMSAPDLALQLRGMAERMTLIEARMQTQGISDERPPDYSAQSTLQ
jgi:hypothetical protein